MMKEAHKQRIGLTILYAGSLFLVNFVTLMIAVTLSYILVTMGVLENYSVDKEKARFILLFMFAVSNIVAGILAAITGKIFLKPINRTIDRINMLASGNFKARLEFGKPIKEHEVFRELAESFNKMAQELESTEMLRSDFINNFSHEFKTPIVSIAGFVKLLRKGHLSEEQRQEYLLIIEEESLRLAAMATNTLNLTKIENQAILTDISSFNLSEQIRSCVLLLENHWSKKKLSWDLVFEEYDVAGNEELLKQVWINLLDNAIKFSPEKQEIMIQITDKPHATEISIVNFGDEIPGDKRNRIFNRFYQAEESHTVKGNGVGLAVVKKIVELHKGEVWVESTRERTAFHVALPK